MRSPTTVRSFASPATSSPKSESSWQARVCLRRAGSASRIFDRTNFGLTNFQERVNFQRALEGELARSISTLSEVEVARVHLVLPTDSLFRSAENQTKASVILRMKRGRSLHDAAVSGIVHLLANSVKGLERSRITVIDYSGRILSRDDEAGPVSGKQLETRMTIETELSNKITQILEPVVGVGRIRPEVSLVMDWRQVEETVEQYDPNASVVRSQETRTNRTPSGVVGEAIGVPGPGGGALDPANQAPPVAEGFVSSQNEVVSYEVSKSIRHIVDPVGEIQRMSVAVIIDNKNEIQVDANGVVTTVSEPWTPAEMTKYRDLVAATVGFDAGRGDSLIVENVSFNVDTLPIEPPTLLEQQAPNILTALRYLIIPVVFLLMYLLFLRPLQKTIFASWEPQVRPEIGAGELAMDAIQTPVSVGQFEQQMNAAPQVNSTPLPALAVQQNALAMPSIANVSAESMEAVTPEREFLPLPSQNKVDLIRERIIEHAQREPETVARLVRVWLNEDT